IGSRSETQQVREGGIRKTPAGPGFSGSLVEEGAQMLASRRVAQLAQRLGLDLTDTLAGYIELLTHLFKGVVSVHVDTEAHAQDLGFPCSEAGEHVASGFLEALHGRHV